METDFITRKAAMAMPLANGQYDHEHANEHFILGLESYKEWLENVPAADVRPVVRGRWIWSDDLFETFICSECGYDTEDYLKYNFCPNCGADMRGGNADA